ncbi:MAG: phenylalanyl-tRNA synthetase beta chain [Parcubacteria group bacterium LiPW_39]|nr:MAG: phenylalanyl-tRNA synthetase beta chain [Parcubacteria group bacterium LiPW_39]
MHAFEIEGCEKFGEDFILDIKILPNRAHDCLSHTGIAKELSVISENTFVAPKSKIAEDKKIKARDFVSVEVPAKDLCPRYTMAVAADVKIGPSPKWMQERLSACGLRPISNIVDITNYVMLETGQPLHAFDVDKVGGKKIIVRRANEGEQITTIEGKTYKLSSQNLVIADEKVAIGVAGIKGGEGPEIDENTKVVAIESANFESTNIRRTSKAFNLKTDASTRFENGLDPELTSKALLRAASLMAEFAGGRVASGLIDVYPNKVKPRKIFADVEWIQGLLGLPIKMQEMVNILKRLDVPAKIIKKNKKTFIEVTPPSSRLDLQAQEDIAEEIARMMGYDKIPALMPSGLIVPAIKNEDLIWEDKIKDILVGLGWSEVYNYSFISGKEKEIFKFGNTIEIKNPLNVEQKYLRPNLLVGILRNVKENLKYFSGIRLFETGRIFYEKDKKYFEEQKIAAITRGKNVKSHEHFFELKGLVEALCEKLGVAGIWFDDAISGKPQWLFLAHSAKRAEIKSGEKLLGWIGEVNPEILAQTETKEKVAFFEINFKVLVDLASEEREYIPPSKYPAILRDLAILVGQDIKIETVLNVIELTGGQLLQDTDLFDIYEGLDGDKKSLAFRLVYQSDERNLTGKEVNALQEKIIKAVEEKGWEVRK